MVISKLITVPSRTEQLDRYIAARDPKTVEDVELYIRQFDKENSTYRIWGQ